MMQSETLISHPGSSSKSQRGPALRLARPGILIRRGGRILLLTVSSASFDGEPTGLLVARRMCNERWRCLWAQFVAIKQFSLHFFNVRRIFRGNRYATCQFGCASTWAARARQFASRQVPE